jgi:hypothetical protein
MITKSNAQWKDTLRNSFANRHVKIISLAKTKAKRKKHDSLFRLLFFEISPEHLFPPRQEAEDMSQQRRRRAQIYILKKKSNPHKKKVKNNNNNKLHLTGMFSKKKTSPLIDQTN